MPVGGDTSRSIGLGPASWSSQPVILVVEDDEANRVLLTNILEREGYRVVPVGDGEAGYRSVAEHSPDLVLLDVGLPKLDGYEVTRRLRLDPRTSTLPILLLTGRSGQQDAVAGLDAGADDFVRKPFERGELHIVDRYQGQQQAGAVERDARGADVHWRQRRIEIGQPIPRERRP